MSTNETLRDAQKAPDREATPGADTGKREAIVKAARVMFTMDGYEATTMAKVAQRAGVAVGTVYLYFQNKNDLLSAVKSDWESEVLHSLWRSELAELPFHLRVRLMIEGAFDICARHDNMVQLMGMQAEMIGKWPSAPPPPIYDSLKTFLDQGVAQGSLRPVDTKAAAVAVYSMVNGTLLHCFGVEQGKYQQLYIDTLVDSINRWLVKPGLADT
ncbi:MAG: TetR/AcrR family transcriptional regulator [Chloroflexota bacterium]